MTILIIVIGLALLFDIVGVGPIRRISAVRWGVTIPILYAWILTIPATGLLAVLIHYILSWVVFL